MQSHFSFRHIHATLPEMNECLALRELYRLWAEYWIPRLRDRQRMQFHEGPCCGCTYFQVDHYRICKETGLLSHGPLHFCDPDTCPVVRSNTATVCAIAGTVWEHVCDPELCPQVKVGEFYACQITGKLFDRSLDTSAHFFEWCTIKRNREPATQYTDIVSRCKTSMHKRAFEIMNQLGTFVNKEEVANCICAAFFHCDVSPKQFPCFIGAMLRILLSSSVMFKLPAPIVTGSLVKQLKWGSIIRVHSKAITHMEKRIRKQLQRFNYTGFVVPQSVRSDPERYTHF